MGTNVQDQQRRRRNFCRFARLVIDVAADVLRDVFRGQYFPRYPFDLFLAKNEKKIRALCSQKGKKQILSPEQIDELFPKTQNKPDLATLDITLLFTLMRNLHPKVTSRNKVWTKPLSTDTTWEADVGRVREARNTLFAHARSTEMDDSTFTKETDELEDILKRLYSSVKKPHSTLSKKIHEVKTDSFDLGQEAALFSRLNLERNQNVDAELQSVRGAIETVAEDVRSMKEGDLQERIDTTKSMLDLHDKLPFVRTKAYEKAKSILTKDNMVCITGIPGSGKSHISRSLMKEVTEEYKIGPVCPTSPEELDKMLHSQTKLCILLDDLLGKYGLDSKILKKTTQQASLMLTCIQSRKHYIILTARNQILSDINLAIYRETDSPNSLSKLLEDEKTISLSTNDCLTSDEKLAMLHKYANEYKIEMSGKLATDISESKEDVLGFPHLCTMLKLTENEKSLQELFKRPVSFLVKELEHLYNEQHLLFATLALFIVKGPDVDFDDFLDCSDRVDDVMSFCKVRKGEYTTGDIQDSCKSLAGTFLAFDKPTETWTIKHELIEKALFIAVSRKSKKRCLKYASLHLIASMCIGEEDEDEAECDSELVHVNESMFKIIFRRIFTEWIETHEQKTYKRLAQCRLWQNEKFRRCFFHFDDKTGALKLLLSLDRDNRSVFVHAVSLKKTLLTKGILELIGPKKSREDEATRDQMQLALESACETKQNEIIDSLLQYCGIVSDKVLFCASRTGDVGIIKKLKSKNANLDIRNEMGRTLVHEACLFDRFDMVKYLEENIPGVSKTADDNNYTSAHLAALGGRVELLQYLLSQGVDLTQQTKSGITCFHLACFAKNMQVVQYLLQHASGLIEKADDDGRNVFHWAAAGGSVKIMEILVSRESKYILDSTITGKTVLHEACVAGKSKMVSFILDKYPQLVENKDQNGYTAAHAAAYSGNVGILEILKGHKIETATDEQGKTLLHLASAGGKQAMVACIMELFPNMLEARDDKERAAVHWAAFSGNVPVFKLLEKKKADIECQDLRGKSVLHFACEAGKEEMIKYIIRKYPQLLTMPDEWGRTALHWAASFCGSNTIRELKRNDVDLSSTDKNNTNALHFAAKSGKADIAEFLLTECPDLLHAVDEQGWTAGHYAASSGHKDMLELLWNKGLKETCVDKNGKTVLSIASEKRRTELVRCLIDSHPALLNCKDGAGWNISHVLANVGDHDSFTYLAERGFDITKNTNNGKCVLHVACEAGHLDMAKCIIRRKRNLLYSQDNDAWGILHSAAYGGNLELFRYLHKACGISPSGSKCRNIYAIAQRAGNAKMALYISQVFPDQVVTFKGMLVVIAAGFVIARLSYIFFQF